MEKKKQKSNNQLTKLSTTEKAEIVSELLGQLGIKGIDAKHLISLQSETDGEGNLTRLDNFSLKKQVFISAYIKSFGNITRSCMAAKITRQAYYYWVENDQEFADYVNNINAQDIKTDFIESKLMENVSNNDTVSIIYADKRNRGYLMKRETFADETEEESIHHYLPDNGRDNNTIDTPHEEVKEENNK